MSFIIIGINVVVILLLFCSFCLVIYKHMTSKDKPDNSYTPFDYITGQSETEFHQEEEQEEDEEDDDRS